MRPGLRKAVEIYRARVAKTKIIEIPRRDIPHLTQDHLAEERLLAVEAYKAQREWQAKRKQIAELLQAGAPTERGVHFAELRTHTRRRKDGTQASRVVLVVR